MASPIVFPSDLRSASVIGRPMVVFTQQNQSVKFSKPAARIDTPMIALPIPEAISVADKSTYGEVALGAIGNAIAAGFNNKSVETGFNNISDTVKAAWEESATDKIAGLVSKVAALKGKGTGLASAANIGAGTFFNPYNTTEFSGTTTRRFSFKFTLIPIDEAEAKTIRDIVYYFRLGVYAVNQGFQLKYPPTWTIRFCGYSGGNEVTELDHIPKIFECYLESASATFNSGANMWRQGSSVDGGAAPFSTDLSLDFMEIRALSYTDIVSLDGQDPNRAGMAGNNEFKPSSGTSPTDILTSKGAGKITKQSNNILSPKDTALRDNLFHSGGKV